MEQRCGVRRRSEADDEGQVDGSEGLTSGRVKPSETELERVSMLNVDTPAYI